jgi:hypothetical protein
MARKVGQIIARGDRRWLIRVYLDRDHETKKRNYHNRTIHGSMREAQAYLTRKLRERDLGRDLEGAKPLPACTLLLSSSPLAQSRRTWVSYLSFLSFLRRHISAEGVERLLPHGIRIVP